MKMRYIFDFGFTKLFINMGKDETAFRYAQNISSWSARTEIHMFYDNYNIKEWRPEGIILFLLVVTIKNY